MRNLLLGDNVKLNAIKQEDIFIIEEWFNNIEFLRYYDVLPAIPHTKADVRKSIEDFTTSNKSYMFAIRPIDKDEIIGIIGCYDIIWTSGVATFFIGIGETKNSGKGIGSEAMKLFLEYGFNELNLYRIQLNVIEYNEIAIKVYEKMGFIREGNCRKFLLRDGKRYDLYLYGLLRDEWVNK
jgi:RimJ/RimL family protein N-acetyltransferase